MVLEKLVRKNIRVLKPYSSARNEYSGSEGIFLDANENAFGSTVKQKLHRYPDPLHQKLKLKIAEIKDLHTDQIFLGNGSDEAIDLLIRIFCEPLVETIMILPPTYGMYKVCADVNNVPVQKVLLTPEFQIDVKKVFEEIKQNTKLIFICSPNNPTGNCFNTKDIETILSHFKGLVILDEAYVDFAPNKSWLPRIKEFEKLVILQTFSKAWGLANIRLGMAFASSQIIQILNNIKYPYNVNGVTQQIALAGLRNINKKEKMVANILTQRYQLEKKLNSLPFVEKIFPSETNFLLVKMKQASKIFNYLLNKKIIVRNRSNVTLCEECLRITVGTKAENKVLIKALVTFNK
jgi:histidinol-phosphate aminotransferase